QGMEDAVARLWSEALFNRSKNSVEIVDECRPVPIPRRRSRGIHAVVPEVEHDDFGVAEQVFPELRVTADRKSVAMAQDVPAGRMGTHPPHQDARPVWPRHVHDVDWLEGVVPRSARSRGFRVHVSGLSGRAGSQSISRTILPFVLRSRIRRNASPIASNGSRSVILDDNAPLAIIVVQ